jgi:hypothetical protein
MQLLLWGTVVVALFALARWGGRTLACHYGDGSEIGAAFALALGAVVPAGLVGYSGAPKAVVVPLLALALSAGLFSGYGPRPRHY